MSTLTVREELYGLPGSSRCPHEQCKLEFNDYAKLYAHLWYHKGLPESIVPIYESCSWPGCSERVIGEQRVLHHLMLHAQAMRHVCPHLTEWERGCRTLCKTIRHSQDSLNEHRLQEHGYSVLQEYAAHPWVEDQNVSLEDAELIGLVQDAIEEEDEEGEQFEVEHMLEIEDADEQQHGPDDHPNREQQPLVVIPEQNIDHVGQDPIPVEYNQVLYHDQQFEDWLNALPFPVVPYDYPQAFEVAVQPQADDNYLNNLGAPVIPGDHNAYNEIPPAFNGDVVPQDFDFPHADQLAGGEGNVEGVFQQAPEIGMMAQAYQPVDNAAGEVQWDAQQDLFNMPFVNQGPVVNADEYGNQQFEPLAVAPYPFPLEDFPNPQGAAPEPNLPVVQPGSVFVPSSNPAPCSAAVAMLALAQPNMGLQALGAGQVVHVLLRLEGVDAPPQEFPLRWDPNTGTYMPHQDRSGVTAQIVFAN
ncbi:hypothetical protein QCA50_001313 [Cerrena zonata]|uniref:C2H2-type domain-containing protein n=1 Tax=Cerrena zonata TaxID=2478898 RepID=A0AAW0H0N2_9APHY